MVRALHTTAEAHPEPFRKRNGGRHRRLAYRRIGHGGVVSKMARLFRPLEFRSSSRSRDHGEIFAEARTDTETLLLGLSGVVRMSQSPLSSSTPTTPTRPRNHLPTPPPTRHRTLEHSKLGGPHRDANDNDDSSDGHLPAIPAGRKGVLAELEYLVADVENTVVAVQARSSSSTIMGHAALLRASASLEGEWWIASSRSDVIPVSARSSVVEPGRSRQPRPLRSVPLFLDDGDGDGFDGSDSTDNDVPRPDTEVDAMRDQREQDGEDDIEMIACKGAVVPSGSDRRVVLAINAVNDVSSSPYKMTCAATALTLRLPTGDSCRMPPRRTGPAERTDL